MTTNSLIKILSSVALLAAAAAGATWLYLHRGDEIPAGRRGMQAPVAGRGASVGWTLKGTAVECSGPELRGVQGAVVEGRAFRGTVSLALTANTGPDGKFELRDLPSGSTVSLALRAQGLAPAAFEVDPLTLPSLDSPLERNLGSIVLGKSSPLARRVTGEDGAVLDGATATSIASASPTPEAHGATQTPREARILGVGVLAFEALERGEHLVQVAAPGHARREVKVDLPRETPVEVKLEPAESIAGFVHDEDGRAIEGARVTTPGVGLLPETRTGPDGLFNLGGLGSGRTTLRITHDGRAASVREAVTGGGPLDITLPRAAEVRGRVVLPDPDLEPEHLVAEVLGLEVGRALQITGVGPGGEFAFEGLQPGRLAVRILTPERTVAASTEVTVTPGEAVDLQPLAIAARVGDSARGVTTRAPSLAEEGPGGRIEGRVLTVAGEPVARALVQLNVREEAAAASPAVRRSLERGDGVAWTDALGRFRITRLPWCAEYEIRADAPRLAADRVKGVAITPEDPTANVELHLGAGTSLRGRIVDEDGQPLSSARLTAVSLLGPSTPLHLPDANLATLELGAPDEGHFVLTGLEPGSWSVAVSSRGFARGITRTFTVNADTDPEELLLALRRRPPLEGIVVDALGTPVQGALVEVPAAAADQGGSTTTGHDGRFRLEGLPAALCDLKLSRQGFVTRLEKGVATDREVQVVLERVGIVSGRVHAPGRRSFPVGEVAWQSTSGLDLEPVRLAPTDEEGFFICDVPPGEMALHIAVPGFAPVERRLAVAPGGRAEVSIELRPAGQVHVKVVAAGSGLALEGVELSLTRANAAEEGERGDEAPVTDEEGTYLFSELEPGEFVLRASHEGYRPARLEALGVRPGELSEVTLELEAAENVQGLVTYRGAISAGVAVAARHLESGESFETTTGPDGRFELAGLAPGDYEFAAGPDPAHVSSRVVRRRESVGEEREEPLSFDLGAVPLTGRVIRDGEGLASVVVSLRATAEGTGDDPPLLEIETDASGAYSGQLPGPGDYVLVVTSGNDLLATEALEVGADDDSLEQDIEVGSE